MMKLWNWLKGKKTYIGVAIGGVIVIAQHLGVPMPAGVSVDQNSYLTDLFQLGLVAAGRHGLSTELAKVIVQALAQAQSGRSAAR